ncbi:MobF family relaxase [Spongiibacter tropicus]|uniref:MobF family relaxase n=1 Tax=Spongiibacter tropicus TaxID=454602 RepID=UPI002357261A|nr:MobF family relaxase [Spongiibacter tropicus]|tara:strand:+ start:4057 stop:7011 length:2955 start_codon:yes stop_codon:yes gene_type:complete
MMTMCKIKSSHQAANYYEEDDYYKEGGKAPSEWYGKGAEALGLSGEVEFGQLVQMLEGRLPNGERVGVEKKGEWVHAPGFDVTFSACKSLSIMALVAGDDRLIEKHRESDKVAMDYIEKAVARCKIKDRNGQEIQETGNLVTARHDHFTSRDGDPQLHSHNLIMNLTQDADGNWRSLDAKELFTIHREATKIYQQHLAKGVMELGYDIERSKHGWELSCVSKEMMNAFSTRRGAIEAWLEKNGIDPEKATAKQTQEANKATKKKKELGVTLDDRKEEWIEVSSLLGKDVRSLVPAKDMARSREEIDKIAEEEADKFLERAIDHLAERESRFTTKDLIKQTIKQAGGTPVTHEDIVNAIEKCDQLVARMVETNEGQKEGFTTKKAINDEKRMLASEFYGRGATPQICSEADAARAIMQASAESEYPFNRGQLQAAVGILSSKNRIVGVQGFAGTSKTNSVVRAVANQAKKEGYEVIGLAPTGNARKELATGGQIEESNTLHSFLYNLDPVPDRDKKQLWILDEASMASAEMLSKFILEAEKHGAKVLLIGDVKQLGSIEAGAALRQLQEAGLEVYVLDEVVRQTNEHTLDGVYHAIAGHVQKAFEAIERGGNIFEIGGETPTERRQAAVADYLSADRDYQKKTILLESTRKGREEVNKLVREGLREQGTITGEDVTTKRFDSKDLTKVEHMDIGNYNKGEIVKFRSDFKSLGIERGEYYSIKDVDYAKNKVILEDRFGGEIKWNPEQKGWKDVSVYEQKEAAIALGDELVWKEKSKDLGLENGETLTVDRIEDSKIYASTKDGREVELDLRQKESQHFDYAYCTTVFGSQGRTAEKVIGVLQMSDQKLLSMQQFYVMISRAKDGVHLYVDDKQELIDTIQEKTGQKETALEELQVEIAKDDKNKDFAKIEGLRVKAMEEVEKTMESLNDTKEEARQTLRELAKEAEREREEERQREIEQELERQHRIATDGKRGYTPERERVYER